MIPSSFMPSFSSGCSSFPFFLSSPVSSHYFLSHRFLFLSSSILPCSFPFLSAFLVPSSPFPHYRIHSYLLPFPHFPSLPLPSSLFPSSFHFYSHHAELWMTAGSFDTLWGKNEDRLASRSSNNRLSVLFLSQLRSNIEPQRESSEAWGMACHLEAENWATLRDEERKYAKDEFKERVNWEKVQWPWSNVKRH